MSIYLVRSFGWICHGIRGYISWYNRGCGTFCHSLVGNCIGNTWGNLRDEMPKIARAEAKARAEIAWELIYKRETTLKGKQSPQTRLGPLALLSLDTPSLNPPCYSVKCLI